MAPQVTVASGLGSVSGLGSAPDSAIFLPAWPYETTRESFSPSFFFSPTLQLGVTQPIGPLRLGAGAKGQLIGGFWAWVGVRADITIKKIILDLNSRYLVHSFGLPQKWYALGAGAGHDWGAVALIGGATFAQRINGGQRPLSLLIGPEVVLKKGWVNISVGGQGRVYGNADDFRNAPVVSFFSHFSIWSRAAHTPHSGEP